MMPGHDRLLQEVSRLTVLTPNEQRANRLRARCRAKLAPPAPSKQQTMGPAVVAGFCLLYLSAIVHDVLQIYFRPF